MVIFDTVDKSLEIKLAGAVATTQLPFVSSYVDIDQTTLAMTGAIAQDGVSNSTTAVTIVAAPGASTSRKLVHLSVVNVDTAPVTLTVQYNNNLTLRIAFRVVLAIGDQVVYADADGWTVFDSAGNVKGVGVAGAVGATGAVGSQGAAGIGVPGRDGDDADLGWPLSVSAPAVAAAAGGSGWGFVSYTTAAGAASITVPSLDLNTHLAYQFVIETTTFGADEGITARVNADTNNDSSFAVFGAEQDDTVLSLAQQTSVTQIVLHREATAKSWSGTVNVFLARDGRPVVNFHMTGSQTATGTGGTEYAFGSGQKNATTNMTSMQFLAINSNTANWRVWCFKANQS